MGTMSMGWAYSLSYSPLSLRYRNPCTRQPAKGRGRWGIERTEEKLGVKPDAHDDPVTYHRLTK